MSDIILYKRCLIFGGCMTSKEYWAIIEEINRIDVGGVDYVEEDEHPELSLLGRGSGDLGTASGAQHQ